MHVPAYLLPCESSERGLGAGADRRLLLRLGSFVPWTVALALRPIALVLLRTAPVLENQHGYPTFAPPATVRPLALRPEPIRGFRGEFSPSVPRSRDQDSRHKTQRFGSEIRH